MKRKLLTLILWTALLFAPTAIVNAQGPNGGDVFLLGQNYTLSSGETLNGSLAVVGGNVMIEEGAAVNGDVVVIGGNLTIDGNADGNVAIIGGNFSLSASVDGDVAVIGGQASLQETAVVAGDVTAVGGQINRAPGAEVRGSVTSNAPLVEIPKAPDAPKLPALPNVGLNFNPLWEAFNIVLRALAVAAMGMLLTLFLQPQLERVADAVVRQPVIAGSFGLLTIVAAPLAAVIMAVTLVLIPAAVLVVLLLPLAWLFGMVALGGEVGERFAKAVNQIWPPVLSAGFGTFLLVLVSGLIGMIPCIGWLFSLLATLFALGGVAMTWFGARPASRIFFTPPADVPPAS